MKIGIILNGISRKKKLFYSSIYPALHQNFNASVFETTHPQHAMDMASRLVAENYDCILAAGGDGTLNQVLNGVLGNHQEEKALPTIGIIPLGTGNDFAMMCDIKPEASQISDLLKSNNPKETDIGKINCQDENGKKVIKYFINVCSMGMGPEVVKRLLKSDRSLGPSITYLKAITSTFFSHRPKEIMVDTKNWQWRGRMRVLAIANGTSFGNAMYIAPDGIPDDGVFSTFLAGDIPLLKFLLYLQMIKAKKKIKGGQIVYNNCTSIEITAPEACAIEAEGEWMGWLPAKIEVQPRRINFLR
ncbi:MAG: YegS/Rv2252/BmrU family lipid kinase [Bacteroidia bacterium]|nr:YegS/Rv2252/BmrU family lipid kinase [Bacteroidia bacterium]